MSDPLHLILELEPDPADPRGRLLAPGADPVAFAGWLALVAALERALRLGSGAWTGTPSVTSPPSASPSEPAPG